jgi:hypothetical protein
VYETKRGKIQQKADFNQIVGRYIGKGIIIIYFTQKNLSADK